MPLVDIAEGDVAGKQADLFPCVFPPRCPCVTPIGVRVSAPGENLK